MWRLVHIYTVPCKLLKQRIKAGVVNPHTNINVLEDTIKNIDLVCLMSVNPGFVQSFIENTYIKSLP